MDTSMENYQKEYSFHHLLPSNSFKTKVGKPKDATILPYWMEEKLHRLE